MRFHHEIWRNASQSEEQLKVKECLCYLQGVFFSLANIIKHNSASQIRFQESKKRKNTPILYVEIRMRSTLHFDLNIPRGEDVRR